MRKVLTGLLFLLFAYCAAAQDHTRRLTGVIKDDGTKSGLAAATVKVKNQKAAAITNGEGIFSLTVPSGPIVLEVSSVGYATKEVSVDESTSNVEVLLLADTKQLDAVVVTALGIKRSEKSITYATQTISNSDLTSVKTDNLMNALNGKVAGVNISPSASGVGSSAKVILRGDRSAAGGNQPLYVIDGVPISSLGNGVAASSTNMTGGPNSTYGGASNADGGDGISNLNPDDIATMTVLKGASAAALYGSQAANGVIIITTKKGTAGRTAINFSSAGQISNASYLPKFQNEYGETAGTPPSTTSWGPKLTTGGYNNLKDFFQTGTNWTNSINLSSGNDQSQTYFSYANTSARGIEPKNDLSRNNFNFNETAKLLHNKLTVNANVNYISQEIKNQPYVGLYFNPLTGLYLFPRGQSILPYKTGYADSTDPTTGAPTQVWPFDEDVQQNPWWIINKNPNDAKRSRYLINASARYEFASWFNVQVRGSLDRADDIVEQDLYAGTIGVLSQPNGQFFRNTTTNQQKYGDVLANFNFPTWGKFKLDGVLGSSINDAMTTGTAIGANQNTNYTPPGLYIPNLFLPQNLAVVAGGSNTSDLPENHNQIQSVFGSADLAWDNWAYLTVTGRNDWSSNLAFTNIEHYFYPSVGLSLVLSQLWSMPSWLNYLKVRGSYAEVGNTVPNYVTYELNHPGVGYGVVANQNASFSTLRPEKTKSWEFGLDFHMLQDRLTGTFTWYKTNTFNQFITLNPDLASVLKQNRFVNAGNFQNTGIEFMLGYDAIKTRHFTWNTNFNGSANQNKIVAVDPADGLSQIILTGNFNNSYESVLSQGGKYGDIWGPALVKTKSGQIAFSDANTPTITTGFVRLGNPNPTFQLGWGNAFTFDRFSFNFLIDGKFGGQVLSMTQAMMDSYGVSTASAAARDAGGVKVNGVIVSTGADNGTAVTSVNAQTWYTTTGGRAGVSGQYMYSATTIRLREADLGYSFPLRSGSAVKSLRLSVTGRNLVYFLKHAPYDPEQTLSTGNGLSGVDVFAQPATRNFGLSLNLGL